MRLREQLAVGTSDNDHTPIGAEVVFGAANNEGMIFKRRNSPYDRLKIGTPECDTVFLRSICKLVDGFPYALEDTSHLHLLDEQVLNAAIVAHPKIEGEKKKRGFISDFCFDHILNRNRNFCIMKRMQRKFGYQNLMFVVFVVWANMYWRCKWSYTNAYGFGKRQWYVQYHTSKRVVFEESSIIRSYVKLEKAGQADLRADILDDALNSGNTKRFFSTLKSFTVKSFPSWGVKKISRVLDDNGLPACSLPREKQLFRSHFAKQLDARFTYFENLVKLDRACVNGHSLTPAEIQASLSAIPTLIDLTDRFARNNPSKARGESRVGGALLARFPKILSTLYYPILIKCYARLHTPLQWKGGVLTELYKNKGSSSGRSNYRDIMLGDVAGKNVASLVRNRLLPLARNMVGGSQYGSGFNGGETAFAHIYMCGCSLLGKKNKCSAAALFVDVTIAFARLLRRILFDDCQGDEMWLRQLKSTGFF